MFKKPIKDQEVKTFEASFSLQWVTCSTSFKINRKEIDFIKAKFLLHTFMTCFSSASLTPDTKSFHIRQLMVISRIIFLHGKEEREGHRGTRA